MQLRLIEGSVAVLACRESLAHVDQANPDPVTDPEAHAARRRKDVEELVLSQLS